jgi:hypothetical protein
VNYAAESELEKAIGRLAKLRRLAQDPQASAGEVHNALAKMRELMDKYAIDAQAIPANENPMGESRVPHTQHRIWRRRLAAFVAAYLGTVSSAWNVRGVVFFGLEADRRLATVLYHVLEHAIVIHARRRAMDCGRTAAPRYADGFVTGLYCANVWDRDQPRNAIILARSAAAEEYAKAAGVRDTKRTERPHIVTAEYAAGVVDGKRQPVTTTPALCESRHE